MLFQNIYIYVCPSVSQNYIRVLIVIFLFYSYYHYFEKENYRTFLNMTRHNF